MGLGFFNIDSRFLGFVRYGGEWFYLDEFVIKIVNIGLIRSWFL